MELKQFQNFLKLVRLIIISSFLKFLVKNVTNSSYKHAKFMLLLPGKNYKDRNMAGTNTFSGESNEKLMNLLLYYTERSQNRFHVLMLRI